MTMMYACVHVCVCASLDENKLEETRYALSDVRGKVLTNQYYVIVEVSKSFVPFRSSEGGKVLVMIDN